MHWGSHTPTGIETAGGFQQISSEIHTNRPIRRMFTAALATAQLALVSAGIENIASQDECGDYDTECHLAQAGLDVPAITGTEGLDPNTTVLIDPTTSSEAPAPIEAPTTQPPPPPTTVAPPPPPAPNSPVGGLSIEITLGVPPSPQERPGRHLDYNTFLAHHETMLSKIPTLEQLNQTFPGTAFFHHVAEQKQRIAELDAAINPSVEKYHALHIDMNHIGVFGDRGSMTPRAFIIHWSGDSYPDGVGQFTSFMNRNGLSVEFFLDKNATAYQFFGRDNKYPAHGLVINDFAQGVEIESGEYDGAHSPVFNYTPLQLENAVYIAVNFLRRNGLPVDRTTLLGHYTADLIFYNPSYDPLLGTFLENPFVRKFDPPQELMHVLVAKAQALDAALGAR